MLTALTTWWQVADLQVQWYGSFAAVGAAGYLLLAHFDERWRARGWALAAGAAGAFAILWAHAFAGSLVQDDAWRGLLPLAYGIVLPQAIATYLRWRWPAPLALIPALTAALGASLLWATIDMRPEWLSVWWAAAALGYLAVAGYDPARRDRWRIAAAAVAGVALILAHIGALAPDASPWQLPAAYGLAFIGASYDAIRRRDESVLLPWIVASMLGASTLWASDVAPEWWPYPALAVAALMAVSSQAWRGHRVLGPLGWPYLLALTLVPVLAFVPVYLDLPEHGMAMQGAAAAITLAAALYSRGALARLVTGTARESYTTFERHSLARVSSALLYGAAAFLNGWLELDRPDTAWVYAGMAVAAWVGLAAGGRFIRDLFAVLLPAGVAAAVIAASITWTEWGMTTLVLAIGTAGPVLAFATLRRWSLLAVAAVFGAAGLATAWQWRELDDATLPLAYATAATLLWGALTPIRRYTVVDRERDRVILGLSWLPWILAGSLAYALLSNAIEPDAPMADIVSLREWAVMASVLAAASLAVTLEGLRLGSRTVWVPGTAGLLAALLAAIAIPQPENIQAYTIPVALYLIGLGFAVGRSGMLIGPHISRDEALIIAGILWLVVPPGIQGLAADEATYGFELIGMGLALLAIGLAVHSRWFVPGGVVTLSATALRWVTGGFIDVPYWLMLGAVGTALLAVGLLLLMQRERWDRFRLRVARWWLEPRGRSPV
jgi:hypothetical protein